MGSGYHGRMFEIMVEETFDAAHCLRGYQGSCENLHGHTYKVQCVLRKAELDNLGISFDFRQVKRAIRDIASELDHEYLNELSAFQTKNPTAENLAVFIHGRLTEDIGPYVVRVTVWETASSAATYYED